MAFHFRGEAGDHAAQSSNGVLPHYRHRRGASPSLDPSFSAMKLFTSRLVFFPGKASSSSSKHKHSDRFDPPKASFSSYYSSYSHYNEAISACIEFFNKSAQDGFLQPRHSHVV